MNGIATTTLIASTGLVVAALISACSRESAAPVEPAIPAVASGTLEGVSAVAENCGGCHVPPRPQAHVAAEWPSVVSRMQDHRRRAGLAVIPPEDLGRIMNYLQQSGGNQ